MQRKETVEQSVGRQIQRIRRERGYTQQVFSEMVGISTNYLSDVERGKKSIRLEKLVLIMNELQCSADDLFMDKIDYGYKVKLSKICDNIDQLSPGARRIALEVMKTLTTELEEIQ